MVTFNYRFFKSLQFWLGLVIAAVAFVGVSVYARMFTPEPVQVLVAKKEIPAYTVLDKTLLAVDAQQLSPKIAAGYVTGGDLAEVLARNAVVVEAVHAGEPLSKARLATGPDALKVSRVALALQETDKVIRTIPVKPEQFPGGVTPGDLVDLYVTFGSSPSGELSYTRTVTNGVAATPTPLPPVLEPAETVERYAARLPVSKRLVSGLLVVRVNYEMVQNPNYGLGAEAQGEAPYIEGQVRSMDVLVSDAEAEKIDFALANGKLTVGVRGALARQAIEQGTPVPGSRGWSWSDFQVEYFEDRLALTPTPAR